MAFIHGKDKLAVTVYLTAKEKQELRETAARSSLTMSEYLRRLITERKT